MQSPAQSCYKAGEERPLGVQWDPADPSHELRIRIFPSPRPLTHYLYCMYISAAERTFFSISSLSFHVAIKLHFLQTFHFAVICSRSCASHWVLLHLLINCNTLVVRSFKNILCGKLGLMV